MAVTTSLHKLAVKEGFMNNVSGMRMLRVGVDARYVASYLPPWLSVTDQSKVAGFFVHAICMGEQRIWN